MPLFAKGNADVFREASRRALDHTREVTHDQDQDRERAHDRHRDAVHDDDGSARSSDAEFRSSVGESR